MGMGSGRQRTEPSAGHQAIVSHSALCKMPQCDAGLCGGAEE